MIEKKDFDTLPAGAEQVPATHDDLVYVHAATSDNTRRAYQADIADYQKKGGALPATAADIEAYLKQSAEALNPRTLKRRLIAISQWHTLYNKADPTKSPLVKKTLKGIARLHGKPKQQATALRLVDLDRILAKLKTDSSKLSVRNQALLLVGFFGALRRAELVSLTWEDIEFVYDGMIISLSHSKTDAAGEGQRCMIPFGDEKRCPVQALIAWRDASARSSDLIFRRISKTGNVLDQAIGGHHCNHLIRAMAKAAGLPHPDLYSSHSLRRGFATEAARLGASMVSIQRHGRWKTMKTVIEYIEAGRSFTDSAAKVLFDY